MMKKIRELLTRYNKDMKSRKDISSKSIDLYTSDIENFLDYLEEIKIDLDDANKSTILQYLLDLQKEGRASSTLARNLSSMKSFYTYLYEEEHVEENPTVNVKTPKIDTKLPDVLTVEEVDELIESLDGDSFKEKRDRAMIELLYSTGVKINELIDLNVEDVNFKEECLYVKDGDNIRYVPIGTPAIEALKVYLNAIKEHEVEALFINNRGGRISRQGFWKNLKGYAEEQDIDKNITLQTLRQSFIVHLIENGADLQTIQRISGHANISSIQSYIEVAKNEDLRKVYNETHPRA